MPVAFEGYTSDGLVRGTLDTDERLEDVLEHARELDVRGAELVLVDGSELAAARVAVTVDDLVAVAASPAAGGPVHAAWHDITLMAGPYHVDGLLATMPGFDPGRALARPGGTFVPIASAAIRLAAEPDAGEAEYAHMLVNRYTVDHVESDIELSLFFPGATSAVSGRAGRPEEEKRAAPSAASGAEGTLSRR